MGRVLLGIVLSAVIITVLPFVANIPLGDRSVALASVDAGGGGEGRSGGGPGGSNGGNGANGASAGDGDGGNGEPEPMLGALPCRVVMKDGGCSWGARESVGARRIP